MSDPITIQYLTHKDIDKKKWDRCIDSSDNGLIYAYSFYLDCMAMNWHALMLNDYEAVMPLTWKKKYGIHYLYQPFLTAQLGIFSSDITANLLENFLNSIPKKFKYIDIYLNHHNLFEPQGMDLYSRSNYVLDLGKTYEHLYSQYSENIRRNIKRAVQADCTVQKGFDITRVIKLALQQMKNHSKESADNVDRFRQLYQLLEPQKKGLTYGISLKDELLASAVFFFSHKRA